MLVEFLIGSAACIWAGACLGFGFWLTNGGNRPQSISFAEPMQVRLIPSERTPAEPEKEGRGR